MLGGFLFAWVQAIVGVWVAGMLQLSRRGPELLPLTFAQVPALLHGVQTLVA